MLTFLMLRVANPNTVLAEYYCTLRAVKIAVAGNSH